MNPIDSFTNKRKPRGCKRRRQIDGGKIDEGKKIEGKRRRLKIEGKTKEIVPCLEKQIVKSIKTMGFSVKTYLISIWSHFVVNRSGHQLGFDFKSFASVVNIKHQKAKVF